MTVSRPPKTLLEFIQVSTSFLESKEIESARLNVQLMLCHILGLSQIQLYTNYDYELSEKEKSKLREFLKRRSLKEPLQYVLGKAPFLDFEVNVAPGVLIPRPETEELVELVFSQLPTDFSGYILEVGTGSGIIPIACSKKYPLSKIVSLDISESALIIAKENIRLLCPANNIQLIHQDISSFSTHTIFDVIISNPPYIPLSDIENLESDVKDFEPIDALTDGNNGLSVYHSIATQSKNMLKENGHIFLELHDPLAGEVGQMFSFCKEMEIVNDMNGKKRVLKAVK